MTCERALAQCLYTDAAGDSKHASLILDCNANTQGWQNTFTGEPLTPAELATVDCLPPTFPPDPCTLIDPATTPWVNNGDGSWSKDLGQGFVISGQHVAGSFPTTVGIGQCQPTAPGSMLSFAANSPCSYPLGNPSVIEFTATRPWPQPFALRIFDIDGTSNTAKHSPPNETVAPSWGIPDSVDGPHASTYRNKGAGQIGAAGAPGNGRDFTLVYNVPPAGPLTFNWHGCCIGFDFSATCDD